MNIPNNTIEIFDKHGSDENIYLYDKKKKRLFMVLEESVARMNIYPKKWIYFDLREKIVKRKKN